MKTITAIPGGRCEHAMKLWLVGCEEECVYTILELGRVIISLLLLPPLLTGWMLMSRDQPAASQ
jgi:hypothetical protein